MKKLVFLDFDGVVMTNDSYALAQENGAALLVHSDRLATAKAYLDPALVERVSDLCMAASADIVLSTSWRGTTEDDWKSCAAALYARGLDPIVQVLGATPHLWSRRGSEIERWLQVNRPHFKPSDFVILDDNGDMEPFMERWVCSTWEHGFGFVCQREALALLDVPQRTFSEDQQQSAAAE